ncbi:MAG TPA: hypothetical protein VKD90_14845 [Gemmataceae bacterium]|nr:hypothetical protein [Gemmataceae bacterium]
MTDFDPTAEPDPARPGCEPGQSALQRLLDGEPGWDTPEAAAHRAACADCREELALARSMVRLPEAVAVPAGLSDRIVRGAIAARRRRNLLRIAGVGAALAAGILVVIWANRPRPEVPPGNGPEIVEVPAPTPEPIAATPPKPLGTSVSEARDAIVLLTKRTATEPGERIGRLVPTLTPAEDPDTSDELQPLADARIGAARSVEPIRESARRAVNFFMRAADPPDRAPQP